MYKNIKLSTASSMFLLKSCLFCFLRLDFVSSLVATAKADSEWAPLTDLKYIEIGLLTSAREIGLPSSPGLTGSVKIWR